MTGPPPISGARAEPVLLVEVFPGQSSTTSAGTLRNGGDVSLTVIRWTQVRVLPQSSVASQVRSTTLTVAPGSTGGCGGNVPSGGCCWGEGNGFILFKFPIEMVLLPTLMASGVLRTF